MTGTAFQLFVVDASQYMMAPLLQLFPRYVLPHQNVFAWKEVPRLYNETVSWVRSELSSVVGYRTVLTCGHQEQVHHFLPWPFIGLAKTMWWIYEPCRYVYGSKGFVKVSEKWCTVCCRWHTCMTVLYFSQWLPSICKYLCGYLLVVWFSVTVCSSATVCNKNSTLTHFICSYICASLIKTNFPSCYGYFKVT